MSKERNTAMNNTGSTPATPEGVKLGHSVSGHDIIWPWAAVTQPALFFGSRAGKSAGTRDGRDES